MKYWINTVSRDHVLVGVEGGFTQANHGSQSNLRLMKRGDLLAFYSPKTKYQNGETLECFTAMGQIIDDEPYQVKMRDDFQPFRRNVEFWLMMESKEVKGVRREGKEVKPCLEPEHCEQTQKKLNREAIFPEKCRDEVEASYAIKTRTLP